MKDGHVPIAGPPNPKCRRALTGKVDGYVPLIGHEPLTPPCTCGLPLLRSDKSCPRCHRSLR